MNPVSTIPNPFTGLASLVTNSKLEYGYLNPIPGSKGQSVAGEIPLGVTVLDPSFVAPAVPFQDNVGLRADGTSFKEQNPAWADTISDQQGGHVPGDDSGPQDPQAPFHTGGDDTDNPGADEDSRDKGPAPLKA